jgi:hypothetical protein
MSVFKATIGHITPSNNYPAAVTNTFVILDPNSYGLGIYEVTLNGTTYKSISAYHEGFYLNRIASQSATTLKENTAHTMPVKVGVGNTTAYKDLVTVYIDYKNDGTFATTERIYQTAAGDGKSNGGVFSINFRTPTAGNFINSQQLRMRVLNLEMGVYFFELKLHHSEIIIKRFIKK